MILTRFLATACMIMSMSVSVLNAADEDTLKLPPTQKILSENRTEFANDNAFEKQELDSGSPFSTENTAPQKTAKKKSDLILKAEAGDGLVKLSWQLADKRLKFDKNDIRYTLMYGTESGKLSHRIGLGTSVSSYWLRRLQNHQVYYIRISGNTGHTDNKQLLTSDEIRVIPLPTEESSSPLEKTYFKSSQTLQDKVETTPISRELRQFGYDFFKNGDQRHGSMDFMPVGGDYIIGPGDSLNISLWGSLNARYELTVDRNGEILIPKVGAIKIWGLTYDQAKEVINKAISRYFKNYDVNITLGTLRTIQVFVVGEVESPGAYQVGSLATVANALSAAGGPTKNGTLRNIKLNRNGKTSVDIDLYDILRKGDRSNDLRLQSGDTLFVPVIGPVVAVAGEVKRPAIYELRDKASLADVIEMAGGVTASGFTGRIQVERFDANAARISLDFEPKDGKIESISATIQDRDMVKVDPVQEAVRHIVSLKGNVVRPGEYQYKKGMRVSDIISGFDMLLPESYLESAEIMRLALPDYHKELLTFNLRKALAGIEPDNVPLQDQDTIKVFSRSEMQDRLIVTINGQVVNPGTYDFFTGMTVRDLITASGSTKRNALLNKAELSRIEISQNKATPSRIFIDVEKAMNGESDHNLLLRPDDVLIVRGITDWLESTDKFVHITGEVLYPGVYSITRGERISSVIARAGGYTDKAYLRGVKYTRKSVKEIQQKRLEEVILRTEKDIIQKQASLASVATSKEELEGTRAALEGLMRELERMKLLKAEGRMVIKLSPIDELQKNSYDIEMEGGDVIDIPPRPNVVHVLGQVYSPTSFVYLPESSSVAEYLNKAGGTTNDAETSELYIIRADGSVYSKQQSSFGIKWNDDSKKWSFGSFMSTTLEPGDSLVVPQKLERTAWLRDIKDITSILANIALTAGTVLIGLR